LCRQGAAHNPTTGSLSASLIQVKRKEARERSREPLKLGMSCRNSTMLCQHEHEVNQSSLAISKYLASVAPKPQTAKAVGAPRSKAQWDKTKPKGRCQCQARDEHEGQGQNCSYVHRHGNHPSPSSTMFGAGIRRKAVPYVTPEIAGKVELFPALKWPSAITNTTLPYCQGPAS